MSMNFSELFQYCPVCGSKNFVVNNEKSKRCEDCGFILYSNPSAATAGFIRNDDGDLLVCRRGKEPEKGTLDLPGGFVDFNETAEQAIAREIKEETGLTVRSLKYLFSLPNDYLYSGLNTPTLDLFFDCKMEDFSCLFAADDVEECFFLPLREINPSLFGLKSIKLAVQMFIDLHLDKDDSFLC